MTLSASLQTQLTKGLAHKQANEQIREHTNIGNNNNKIFQLILDTHRQKLLREGVKKKTGKKRSG